MDRAAFLMNERDYLGAIESLKEVYEEDPNDQRIALLYAQAHLGAGGFELFDLLKDVTRKQQPNEIIDLQMGIDCEVSAVNELKENDLPCLIKRIMSHVPDADNPFWVKGREILRNHFPDISNAPIDVNFLSTVVEASSAIFRARELIRLGVKLDHTKILEDDEIVEIIHHLKRFLVEAQNTFLRARYSYGKISKFILSNDGKPIITVGENQLIFDENVGIPAILDFASKTIEDNAESVDKELNQFIGDRLSFVGKGLMRFLYSLDIVAFEGDGSEMILVLWKFEKALARLLRSFSETLVENSPVKPMGFFWKSPPKIIENFLDSFNQTWEKEDLRFLKQYFFETRDQWASLGRLQDEWRLFFEKSLRVGQKDSIHYYFRFITYNDPDFGPPPPHLSPDNLLNWYKGYSKRILKELEKICRNENPSTEELTPEQMVLGINLIRQTENWIQENLWDIKK